MALSKIRQVRGRDRPVLAPELLGGRRKGLCKEREAEERSGDEARASTVMHPAAARSSGKPFLSAVCSQKKHHRRPTSPPNHPTPTPQPQHAARTLLTLDDKDTKRIFEGAALMRRMYRYGFLDESQTKLDYVLALTPADVLERRLQTLVFKLGLAKSIHHARVLIRQRHIRVGKQVVNVPSFMVRVDAQKHIDFALSSPFGGGRPGRNKRKANAAKKARKAAKENKDEDAEEEEEEE